MNESSVDPVKFWAKVDRSGSCWIWKGALRPGGYGTCYVPATQSTTTAHRVSYVLSGGVIPEGLHLDHLCRNRQCVNPDHLEPVTPKENNLRGFSPAAINSRKSGCYLGHEFRVNSRGYRYCHTCRIDQQRKRRRSRKVVAA